MWPGDYIGHGRGPLIEYIGHGPKCLIIDGGCLNSLLFTSRTWPGDYFRHGPIDVCHDRWGLPDPMVVHVGCGPKTTLDTAR